MHLFVAGSALPGTYTNLLLRGAAHGLSDRTVPLTLTITTASFILALSSSTISIAQGASTPTTTVNLLRHHYTGPVSLYVISYDDHVWYALPPGVTAAFSHNPATGDSSVLTLSVDAATVPGVYYPPGRRRSLDGVVGGEAHAHGHRGVTLRERSDRRGRSQVVRWALRCAQGDKYVLSQRHSTDTPPRADVTSTSIFRLADE